MTSKSPQPDYGIDAPGVIRNLAVIGIALLIGGWYLPAFRIGPVIFIFRPMAWWTGTACVIEAVLMVLYAKYGKLHHRDRMLNMVTWKGDEIVLDVGTGRGLLMIGAAKRLTTGKSIGIDIWSAKDLSGNALEKTLRNADIEGVRTRVDVQDGDATKLNFPDATFDVIVSNLCIHNIPSKEGRDQACREIIRCIHNIPSKEGRDQACREIIRVLKPGGKALISDFIRTGSYLKTFQSAGAAASRTGMDFLFTFPPLRIVEVSKPLR